jgi:hypothetical protein
MGACLAAVCALLAAAPAAPKEPLWTLSCHMPSREEPAATRLFQIGKGSLYQWMPDRAEYGPNLCDSFECSGDEGKFQGSITGATLTLSIALDPATRQGTWSTVGASGLTQKSGVCDVMPGGAGGG